MSDLFLERTADISPCGLYRWSLRRHWPNQGNGKTVCFVMLNPSVADATKDDPTIRRCMGFARQWNYSTLEIRNIFALRSTDPKGLLKVADPVGGERGDQAILDAQYAETIIVAWGANVPLGREEQVHKLLKDYRLYCLGRTKSLSPRHPLYVRGDKEPEPYVGFYSDPKWAAQEEARDGQPSVKEQS